MAYLGEQSAPRDSKTIIDQQGYMLDLGKMVKDAFSFTVSCDIS